jgi:predicted nucleotidyltransferase
MIFENIFRSFDEIGLKYVVIGGVAVNLHGYNRLTGDLDIIISLDDENISKFVSVTKSLGLVPRLPVQIEDFSNADIRNSWVSKKNMKVFSVYNPSNPLEHIDVKIDNLNDIETYLSNSEIVEAGDIKIYLVSLDDLIKLKQEAGRERDFVDIRALERIRRLDD